MHIQSFKRLLRSPLVMSWTACTTSLSRIAYRRCYPLGAVAASSFRGPMWSLHSHGGASPRGAFQGLWANTARVSLWRASICQIRMLHGERTTSIAKNKPAESVTPQSWVSRLPSRVQSYALLARIDKPIGTLLLYYPCGMQFIFPCSCRTTPTRNPPCKCTKYS